MRGHLLNRAGLPNAKRVLEVGCGTGAVLGNIAKGPRTSLHGLDIDQAALQTAKRQAPTALLARGDAHKLPYGDRSFDIVFTHFVLLWLAEPAKALAEMRRVTRRGGTVLALAEPDYSQRIDLPARLAELGQMQTEALRAQGADPTIGGRLSSLFSEVGFEKVETGKIGSGDSRIEIKDWELELEVLRADLAGRVAPEELERMLAEDERAWQIGERVLQVPAYYAWGRVP